MNCARLTPDRRIEIAEYARTILGLGLEILKLGYLQKSNISNLVKSLKEFQRNFHKTNVTKSQYTAPIF